MKTASIGRRLGDWLGVVPEEEAAPPVGNAVSPDERSVRERPVTLESVPAAADRPVMSFRDVVNQRRQLSR